MNKLLEQEREVGMKLKVLNPFKCSRLLWKMSPIEKIKESKKIYNRKKNKYNIDVNYK